MTNWWVVLLFIGPTVGLLFGVGLLFFANRIHKWSVDTFYGGLDRFGRKLYGKYYEPPADPYRPHKLLIWFMRLIGAGFIILNAFGFYGIVTTFLL